MSNPAIDLIGFDPQKPFHAYCLVADRVLWRPAVEFLGEKLQIAPADRYLQYEPTKVTIDEIRQLERFLRLKPYQSPHKLAVINGLGLSVQAAHALLKSLEEPSGSTIMVVCCPTTEVLLPTLVSRCQPIKVRGPVKKLSVSDGPNPKLVDCRLWPIQKRLKFVDDFLKTIDHPTQLVDLVDFWLAELYDTGRHLSQPQLVSLLLQVKQQLTANVQARLVLESLMLSL